MAEQRLIDANALRERMYHDAFETDTDMQKWDSGCWIRYKMFENAIDDAPTIEERKNGKWIIEPYDAQNDIFIHRCGECMRVAMLGGHTTKYKYCPICGSAMEGEQP